MAAKLRLSVALLLGGVTSWTRVGLLEANGGDFHLGALSSTASVAVVVAAGAMVCLFVAVFILSWRRASQSVAPELEEADAAPESENEDDG